jgi:hypothetical protein
MESMTTSLKVAGANGPLAVAPGTRLLGEIITWSCPGVSIRHAALIQALREAGLDEKVARELAPRHAFTRACKKLSERRIIRAVSEDSHELRFQFTSEQLEGGRFRYDLEAVLALDKHTGRVSCDVPNLATLAQEQLDQCIANRNGQDVTRIIQRLFEKNADLFPIRDRGGCYFVPERHAGFVDQIDSLVRALKGSLRRFPVPAGTAHGDRSVKEAVASGIAALIAEHSAAVEGFGADTRPDTLTRAAERIRQTRFKLESYAAYLAEERARLERDLADAQAALRAKVESLTASSVPAGTKPPSRSRA